MKYNEGCLRMRVPPMASEAVGTVVVREARLQYQGDVLLLRTVGRELLLPSHCPPRWLLLIRLDRSDVRVQIYVEGKYHRL